MLLHLVSLRPLPFKPGVRPFTRPFPFAILAAYGLLLVAFNLRWTLARYIMTIDGIDLKSNVVHEWMSVWWHLSPRSSSYLLLPPRDQSEFQALHDYYIYK